MSYPLAHYWKMIKNIYLNHKAKPIKKAEEHCTYEEARAIGILYNADEFGEEVSSELTATFEKDGRKTWLYR